MRFFLLWQFSIYFPLLACRNEILLWIQLRGFHGIFVLYDNERGAAFRWIFERWLDWAYRKEKEGKRRYFWAHKNTYIGLGHTLPTTKQQFLTFLRICPETHSIWLASWSRSDRPTIDRRLKSAITKEQSILFLTLSFPHVQYMSVPKIWVFPRVLYTQLSYL